MKAINHWLTGLNYLHFTLLSLMWPFQTVANHWCSFILCVCSHVYACGLNKTELNCLSHYRKQDGGEPCISNTLDPSLFQPSLPHTGPAFLKVSQSSSLPACWESFHPANAWLLVAESVSPPLPHYCEPVYN